MAVPLRTVSASSVGQQGLHCDVVSRHEPNGQVQIFHAFRHHWLLF